MKKEDLIKKWLDYNLSPEELKEFEQLEDYNELTKLNSSLRSFKAPVFPNEDHLDLLKTKLTQHHSKNSNWLKIALQAAAVLVLGLSIYYYTTTLKTNYNTTIAEQTRIELPDASIVKLNSNSSISFNENNWDKRRTLNLKGEAFFNVAKGKTFEVLTEYGIVRVLGTQFNVNQRKQFFEVTCYEGSVSVTHKNSTIQLKSGQTFRIINGKLISIEKEKTTQPHWLNGESNFKRVPLDLVFSEFENQYNVDITVVNIDTNREFTGSFTHKNLDLALQSVTIPLNLNYSIEGKSIVITRD